MFELCRAKVHRVVQYACTDCPHDDSDYCSHDCMLWMHSTITLLSGIECLKYDTGYAAAAGVAHWLITVSSHGAMQGGLE